VYQNCQSSFVCGNVATSFFKQSIIGFIERLPYTYNKNASQVNNELQCVHIGMYIECQNVEIQIVGIN
jgi:hypothetical protein